MKKIFAFAIVAMMALGMTSCNWGTTSTETFDETNEDTTMVEEVEIDTIGCDTTAMWFDSLVSVEDTVNE